MFPNPAPAPALVSCPVCTAEISNQAPNCIKCGHPMESALRPTGPKPMRPPEERPPDAATPAWGLIATGLGLGAALMSAFGCLGTARVTPTEALAGSGGGSVIRHQCILAAYKLIGALVPAHSNEAPSSSTRGPGEGQPTTLRARQAAKML
jgi:hypothetical protein